jgi:hypothetical protein
MMRWQDGPINSPMGSPRMMGSMSPRANTAMGLSPRSSQVQGLYYQQAMQQQMPGSHQFWDSFVAKQNAKALDTLSRSGHMSPRAVTPGFLSPRSRNTTVPRLVPGKTLSESLGIALPPLSPRASASPRARRAFMAHTLEEAIRPGAYKGSIDVATERRLKEAAKRKAQLSSLERRIVTDTENALNCAPPPPPPSIVPPMRPLHVCRARRSDCMRAPFPIHSPRSDSPTASLSLPPPHSPRPLLFCVRSLAARFADMWSAFKNVDVDASGKINKDEIMKALRMWNVTGQNASVAEEAEAILKMCDVDGTGSRVLIRVLRPDSAPAHPESHAVSAHGTLLSASIPSALRLYPSSRSLLSAFHRGPLRPSALPLPSLCPAPSQATARSRTRSSSTASPTTGTCKWTSGRWRRATR